MCLTFHTLVFDSIVVHFVLVTCLICFQYTVAVGGQVAIIIFRLAPATCELEFGVISRHVCAGELVIVIVFFGTQTHIPQVSTQFAFQKRIGLCPVKNFVYFATREMCTLYGTSTSVVCVRRCQHTFTTLVTLNTFCVKFCVDNVRILKICRLNYHWTAPRLPIIL